MIDDQELLELGPPTQKETVANVILGDQSSEEQRAQRVPEGGYQEYATDGRGQRIQVPLRVAGHGHAEGWFE